MEPDMHSEKWSPPSANKSQSSTGSKPETKSFFQQDSLQQTWMNVKLATWIKCVIIIGILFAVAAYVAPKLSTAQATKQQNTPEFIEYQYEKGSWIDANECFLE